MDIIGAKILSGFIFFVLASFFGWMPYFCFRQTKSLAAKREENRQTFVIQCLHSLASGVLLATSLLHLLPESLDAVQNALFPDQIIHTVKSLNMTNITNYITTKSSDEQSQSSDDYYPVAECLVAFGFLFIYIIDSVIGSCSTHEKNRNYFENDTKYNTQYNRQRQMPDEDLTEERYNTQYNSPRQIPDIDTSQQENVKTDNQFTGRFPHKKKLPLQFRWLKPKLSTKVHNLASQNDSELQAESKAFLESDEEQHEFDNDLELQSFSETDNSSNDKTSSSVEAHPLTNLIKSQGAVQSSSLRSVALVTALCIHGFFDGVMLGLQTSLPVVMSLLLALSIHKSFVSVGLSLTLLGSSDKNVPNCIILFYVLLFASVAPLGLLASAAFLHQAFDVSNERQVSLVPGCLQAFAVGTFLYVTFAEMMKHDSRKKSFLAVIVSHLCLLLGFGLMAALRAFLGST